MYVDENSPTTLYQAMITHNFASFNDNMGFSAFQQAKGCKNTATGNANGNFFHVYGRTIP